MPDPNQVRARFIEAARTLCAEEAGLDGGRWNGDELPAGLSPALPGPVPGRQADQVAGWPVNPSGNPPA